LRWQCARTRFQEIAMGMFDTVNLSCPRCGERTSFQTKAGPCVSNNYELAEMPADIVDDLQWKNVRCEICDAPIHFKRTLLVVKVEAVSENSGDEIISGASASQEALSDLSDRFSSEDDEREESDGSTGKILLL